MLLFKLIILVIFNINFVLCEKRSLTFVIDHTISMQDDIDQVLGRANDIFDTVLKSNHSQIENFVLVTFNDPSFSYLYECIDGQEQTITVYDANQLNGKPLTRRYCNSDFKGDTKLLNITKDRSEFKNALSSIKVQGGADCPEYSMSGIEMALENSLPGSFLFIFTDASAKDYAQFEKVKNLAMTKQSQIVFVLTNKCPQEETGIKDNRDFTVYHDLAKATSGKVFEMYKGDVNEFFKYVIYNIENPPTLVTEKEFPPGYGHEFTVTFDVDHKDVLVSVTGTKPKVYVKAPDGTELKTESMMTGDNLILLKIIDVKPETYTIGVGSESSTSVQVLAKSTIQFKYGFSTFWPSSFNDITSRPVPDVPSHICVQMIEGNLELTELKVLSMDDEVIEEIPLYVLNETSRLYATNLTNLPSGMFRIAISGYVSEFNVTRFGTHPVEPQQLLKETAENRSPEILIEGEKTIKVAYDKKLQLKCHVDAYPAPVIEWVDKNTGTVLPANVLVKQIPYDYISILDIKVTDNRTYECRAKNENGYKTEIVNVRAGIKHYFTVVEAPRDTIIGYKEEGHIICNIDSYPEPNITWYHDGKLITNKDDTEISEDGSVLTIKSMNVKNKGTYKCEAKTDFDIKQFYAEVNITGVAKPVIDKVKYEVVALKHSDVSLSCRILEGIPEPDITWFKQNNSNEDDEIENWFNQEDIVIKNVDVSDAGIYICEANNDLGTDIHEVDLVIHYPPEIKPDVKDKLVKVGEEVFISCSFEASPEPEVNWYFNDKPLIAKTNIRALRDHSIKIKADLHASGIYRCVVQNSIGTDDKSTEITVYEPVTIKPEEDLQPVKVGSTVQLSCQATGHPTPNLKWIYKSFNSNTSKIIRHVLSSNGSILKIPHIQIKDEGYYTCEANNFASSANYTYKVSVHVPPIIENTYLEKRFIAVEGDLVLKIKCQATGNPKPVISWRKDGMPIVLGDSYSMENGTLVIKNLRSEDSGVYVCSAVNYLGSDDELYEVEIDKYPRVKYTPKTVVYAQVGEPTPIQCRVPHEETDYVRWYKYNDLIATGELILSNPQMYDRGVYTCRVSNFVKSKSDHIMLQVGYKPKFNTEEETNVELVAGTPVFLNCEAMGRPTPQVTWYHNSVRINSTDIIHIVKPEVQNRGTYVCEVKNELGNISRTFNVTSRDCIIDTKKLSKLQPLMLTPSLRWPKLHDGQLIINKGNYMTLFCPTQIGRLPSSYVTAFCDGGTTFLVRGVAYDFSELKCTEEMKHTVKWTGSQCRGRNTEIVKIAYTVLKHNVDVFEVCFDKDKRIPLYTKQYVGRSSVGSDMEADWSNSNSDAFGINFDELYDCEHQSLGLASNDPGWMCFKKRQLVNPRDVFVGPAQKATFTYFNVVPQCSNCANNWNELERVVRELAKSSLVDLLIWTGISDQVFYESKPLSLADEEGHGQPIPEYLWKVIQDPYSRKSLAVIQINKPNLKPSEINKYERCFNICRYTNWMNDSRWKDLTKGYIYCCSLLDFEIAFGFKGKFLGYKKILDDVSHISMY